jgi:hypothetical protein
LIENNNLERFDFSMKSQNALDAVLVQMPKALATAAFE